MVGSKLCLHGTVLATEEDGDFLLETHGKLAFVDVGDLRDRVEIGDRVVVSGVVEDDGDEGEATELDAVRIQAWLK